MMNISEQPFAIKTSFSGIVSTPANPNVINTATLDNYAFFNG
jgi:hypothetical protein